jgi:regulatory protein
VSRDKVFAFALKTMARREHSARQLRDRIRERFPDASPETVGDVLNDLAGRNYVDDRRFAAAYVASRLGRGRPRLQAELEGAGVETAIIASVLDPHPWPSIRDLLRDKMKTLRIAPPLEARDAARLSRALQRLGYDGEDVRLELENLL